MTNLLKGKRKIIFTVITLSIMLLCGILITIYETGISTASETTLAPQEQNQLNKVISLAIKGTSSSYGVGETATEGHIILYTEEKNTTVKVYTIASLGVFGFENGIFTIVSGTGAIPTVMTFSKKENGEYLLLKSQEPMDGSYYSDSIKKMFPEKLWNRVFESQKDYNGLADQQKKQAEEYLQGIGRKAKISTAYVERKLPNINVDASNKLFAELTKYDAFLNSCPYWLGTREKLEDGVRYIYKTVQGKTTDGFDLMTYSKTKEDGTLVKEVRYRIVGSEPQLMK